MFKRMRFKKKLKKKELYLKNYKKCAEMIEDYFSA